ncbi:MACRO domain-containing protein 2 [Wickerhamomyces ciferrii]|uniref:MACRO domain-containing protein 2 n=1 Tax=Wickerhamomyces ciferrii (strain ATCC 14091 / BCRC 22168 / CBS 111 / JCM 3599 / NBRC 0793 / NRRL Y-1031 F-60-10) TaxID=1206466 RepID=K0KR13_WICCF|nr:MACRO domain-containing protein 2 [Wickerhamomyces ciferrii]CCH45566.1 MACRO domain-containing protein 2 [Wickerhamomyces ciferrii]
MRLIFIDRSSQLVNLWERHFKEAAKVGLNFKWFDKPIDFSVQRSPLCEIKVGDFTGRSAVVSPGNSLGELGGGLDQVIGEIFSPNWNYHDTSNLLKNKITNGYAPPGCVKALTLPDNAIKSSLAYEKLRSNTIIHCPTMRIPRDIAGLGDLHSYRQVFDWTWEILRTADEKNHLIKDESDRLGAIILPGLGTGFGKIPSEVCSKSMIAAALIFTLDNYTAQEKALFALRYLGEDSTKLNISSDKIPKTPFSPEQNSISELFLGTNTSA